jgi:hypothetical protein
LEAISFKKGGRTMTFRHRPKYYKYENADPSTSKYAPIIADELLEIIKENISKSARRIYHIRDDSILAIDLKNAVIYELFDKLAYVVAEIEKFEREDASDLRNYPFLEPENTTTEYDKFWNDVVIHESNSESVKKDKMNLQDKLRGIVNEDGEDEP